MPGLSDWMDLAIAAQQGAESPEEAFQRLVAQRERDGWYNAPQAILQAPAEHFLFARAAAAENPWNALWLGPATLGYQAYKALGLKPHATPASFAQLQAGLSGTLAGLLGD